MASTVSVRNSNQSKNGAIQKVGTGSKLQKEYNITSGNLSKQISSESEINDKICKVMKKVKTDKKHMKKIWINVKY